MNKKGKCSEFSPLYIAKSRVEKYATDQTGDSSKVRLSSSQCLLSAKNSNCRDRRSMQLTGGINQKFYVDR